MQPSIYDNSARAFVWEYNEHELHYITGEEIKFKVNLINAQKEVLEIGGEAMDDGLGLVSWWN